MKLKLLFALLFCSITAAFAQTYPADTRVPFQNTYERYSQMWNINSVYYNAPTASTLGQQIDTCINTTKYVWVANFGAGKVNRDTFTAARVTGTGTLLFNISCLKAATNSTVTPTAVFRVEHSPNNYNWSAVTSASTFTLQPTSKTVSTDTSLVLTARAAGFYRIRASTTDTISYKCFYQFVQNFQYQKQ